jgi:hypothetical protein
LSWLVLGCALGAAALSATCRGAGLEPDPALRYPEFAEEEEVKIAGYDADAMEPFVTADGRYMFFNSLNDGRTTSLYHARRESDTAFTFAGEIAGVNGAPPHLDAVASMDEDGRFYFVSTRDYPAEIRNYLGGWFQAGAVSRVAPVDGDFYVRRPGWLIMDAEISTDGERLYYVNARFSGKALPDEARLGMARRRGEAFLKEPSSDELFARVNHPGDLVYAPATTSGGRELYLTRIRKGTLTTEICVSLLSDADGVYSVPQPLPIEGRGAEAPSLTRDGSRIYYHKKVASDGRYRVFTMRRRATQ